MVNKWFKKSRAISFTALILALLFSVACGSAAAPETTAPDTSAPAPVATAAPSAPTAVPESMSEPAEATVNPGKVTWMMDSWGAERFDPTFNSAGHDYGRILHAFIISSDLEEGQRVFAPGVLTKWEMSSDGLTWTLTVREGVKFHDGTDLTAADVMWTLQHAIGPQAPEWGVTQTLARIMDRIEQTGPDQVSLITKVPAVEFPERVSDASGVWYGAVLPKRATLHDVKEEQAYDLNPIGAGPMRLVKHVPVELMAFERFADYYHQPDNGFAADKRVNFTELDLRLIPEEATRVAAIRAGDADIGPVSLEARAQVEAGGGRLVFGPEGVVFQPRMVGCWNRPGRPLPCDDKRVRQAINYALDKELIRDQLYGAEVLVVKGWVVVTPSTIGYSPELDPYPFDPVKARQLLADAGYPGGEGFGKLVINTWPSTATPLMVESAQLAAEMWKRELGLDTEVVVGEEAGLKKASKLTEDLHGQILWRDNEARIDAVGTTRNSFGNTERNARLHNDPELFAFTNKALDILDPVEREKAIRERLYPRLRDEAVYIGIGYTNIPWAVGPRILTWEPYPLSFYPSALFTITLK